MLHFGKSSPDALKSAPHHALTHEWPRLSTSSTGKNVPPACFFFGNKFSPFFWLSKNGDLSPILYLGVYFDSPTPRWDPQIQLQGGKSISPKKTPPPTFLEQKSLGFFGCRYFQVIPTPISYSLKLKNWTHPNVVNSGFLLDTTSYPAARYIFFFFPSNMSPDTFGMDSLWLGLRKHQ